MTQITQNLNVSKQSSIRTARKCLRAAMLHPLNTNSTCCRKISDVLFQENMNFAEDELKE